MNNQTVSTEDVEFKIVFNELTPEIISELSKLFERLNALDQLPNVNGTYLNGSAIPMPFPHSAPRYFNWFTKPA